MYRKGRRRGTVEFVLRPSNGQREVFVAGDLCDWKPLAMKKRKDGLLSALVPFVRPNAGPWAPLLLLLLLQCAIALRQSNKSALKLTSVTTKYLLQFVFHL